MGDPYIRYTAVIGSSHLAFAYLPNPDERDKSLHEKFFAKNMQIIFLRD